MRKINDLQAEDFPGVDAIQFAQWKDSRLKAEKTRLYLIIGLAIVLFILGARGGVLQNFLIGMVLFAVVHFITMGGPKRLADEIGLTEEAIQTALKR